MQWLNPLWLRLLVVHGLLAAASLLVYVLRSRNVPQQRHPSAAIAWVLGLAAFPSLVLPAFLLFGARKRVPRARPARPRAPGSRSGPPAAAPWAHDLLAALDVCSAQANQSVTFHDDGEAALQAFLGLCAEARTRLDVCTFEFGADAVGALAAEALADACSRGVRVRLLIDAVGSRRAPRRLVQRLQCAGVALQRFAPLWQRPWSGGVNARNHRKLAVADAQRLWAGGRNLTLACFRASEAHEPWIDMSFSVVGPLAHTAAAVFEQDWQAAGGHAGTVAGLDAAGVDAATAGPWLQWISTGPDHAEDTLHALLLAAAYHARDCIVAVTPYFVPDEALLEAWCLASRRGVHVQLILPANSNHRLADLVRTRALERLVLEGADVRLVDRMVHAKVVVVDDGLALCGSANLDGRSLFVNHEATCVFHGAAEIAWLTRWATSLGQQGVAHVARPLSLRGELMEGALRVLAFQL